MGSLSAGLSLVYVFFCVQPRHHPLERCLELGRSPSGRNFHLLDRTLEVALSAGHSCHFRVNDPVVRIPLDVGPEDLKCLRLLALALKLASITVKLKCVSHADGFDANVGCLVLASQCLENL